MSRRIIGTLLFLAVFVTSVSVYAASPRESLPYKTLLATDDYYVALKTDSLEWTTPPNGDITLSLTAKWAYAKPERAVRNYPGGKQSFAWRISKYAVQYDRNTGFVRLLELETVLYDTRGQEVAWLKNANANWRLLTPPDPDFEAFDKIIGYLATAPAE